MQCFFLKFKKFFFFFIQLWYKNFICEYFCSMGMADTNFLYTVIIRQFIISMRLVISLFLQQQKINEIVHPGMENDDHF